MKPLFFLCALLATAISFTGCSSESMLDSVQQAQEPPSPALAAEPAQCNNYGVTYWFSLQVNQPGAPQDNQGMIVDMDYYSFLGSTALYRLNDDCECKILNFRILFDYLPNPSEIYLRDENGNTIPFTGPFSQVDGQLIVIDKDDISVGINGGVNIGFYGDPGVRPRLKSSGGYCIIENVDAPILIADIPMTYPYFLHSVSPDNNEPFSDIYMPISSLAYQVP